jgi:diguanylate cyclase (GGDEF)-like protein
MEKPPLILIADDDRSTRLVLKNAMEQNGYEVVEAVDGSEAVAAFDARRPDLVLLDVIMPGMDGFAACRTLRDRPGGLAVPIVIITAANDMDAIRDAYNAGATDFIPKPISRIILKERARYMLRASQTAAQLQRSQELLARAQSLARLGSFFYVPGSAELQTSEEFRRILELDTGARGVTWEDFWNRIHPDDQKALSPLFEQARTVGAHFQQDIRILSESAGERYAMLQVNAETDCDGRIARLAGIIQDITDRKLSELLESSQNLILQRIARQEPLERIFAETALLVERQCLQGAGVICEVSDGRIQNVVAPSLAPEYRQALIGTPLSAEGGTCAAAAYLGEAAVAENIENSVFWKEQIPLARAHGFRSSASVPIFSASGRILGTVGVMRRQLYHSSNAEIELMERMANLAALAIEQQHLRELLTYQAQHDSLTGLINRGALRHWLSQRLKQLSRSTTQGAYLLIDLDRFKQINDSLGHPVGDTLLQAVAHRLQSCLRETDLLSRVGGDEFVLFMPEIHDQGDPVRAAYRILEAFHEDFVIDDHRLHVEASIGITFFPQDATDADALHRNADIAMYVAKNQGGNRFQIFDSKMQEALVQRLRMENDLRKALERGEFELYYQPQLDLYSNRVVVLEALIRWNHPEGGRIPAERFIHVAEESRLIIPIGRWVLEEACRQNLQWQKEGLPPVRVAVNVSTVQFSEPNFAETVRDTLERIGLSPRWLEVEITETVLLNDIERALANLKRLKELGITTTLDDFGTGYSSITYLREMPLDGIKIDKSFIRDMETAPVSEQCRNTNFIKAFSTLARNLNLQLVAEGIETEDQSNALKALGYTIGQGFLFSLPLSGVETGALLVKK